jgi:hypothetical protein
MDDEFKETQNALTRSKYIRRNITNLNSDYEAKRSNNMTLNPLVINVARKNLFYDWQKINWGQNPKII